MHVPPFVHGYDEHSSTLMPHVSPAHPGTHAHFHCVTHAAFVHAPSLHVPPFMHGEEAHSDTSEQVLPPFDVS